MRSTSEKNWTKTLYLIGSFSLFLVGIFYFSYMEYRLDKTHFYEQLDEKLRISASITDSLLTPEFHDRALNPDSISADEYTRNIHRLSQLSKKLNVVYIYTMVERNGEIYFTASSATDEELKTGINLTTYFERYDDPSEELKKTFKTHKRSFDEYSDKWGTFRSIFLPMKSPQGHWYVIAADVRTDVIHRELNNEMGNLVLRLLILLAFGLPFLALHFRRINEQQIYQLSNFDLLTQLPNKKQLENYCNYMFSLAHRNHTLVGIMLIDIDHFKSINDSVGHATGDKILIEASHRLKSLVRESDMIARYNADQFIMAFSINDMHGAEKVAQKVLRILNKSYRIDFNEYTLTASIGIALFPTDGLDFETLFRSADTALYGVKLESRNHYRFITPEMQSKSLRYLQLNNALHNALKNNEFHIVYQPQISAVTGELVGAEALIRWNHPELGTISPSEFISIAEDNGLILPIGEWVLRTAVAQTAIWNQTLMRPLVIAINISAVQFRHPKLAETIIKILDEFRFPHQNLELELTESMAMNNPDEAVEIMNTLSSKGIRMSIDDFGTGYSSLNYLKKFKINKLKIDQSFVHDICTNSDDRAIATAVINMAHSLGFQTIAEGVEREDQLLYLQRQGCDEIQGYYYSAPCSPEEFEKFIGTHSLT